MSEAANRVNKLKTTEAEFDIHLKVHHPRSVLEALLKRGSRVVLTSSNQALAHEEHKRLR